VSIVRGLGKLNFILSIASSLLLTACPGDRFKVIQVNGVVVDERSIKLEDVLIEYLNNSQCCRYHEVQLGLVAKDGGCEIRTNDKGEWRHRFWYCPSGDKCICQLRVKKVGYKEKFQDLIIDYDEINGSVLHKDLIIKIEKE